jgi:hypothetical protein
LIPVRNAEWAERELNDFVESHRVLAVDRRWVDQGENSFWTVWVDYLEPGSGATGTRSKRSVDYREVLSPEDFEVFAKLRVLRKEISGEDGVALYNVFTNEQLAQIVQSRAEAYAWGLISEQELQDRATALVAFTTAGGTKSWKFRTRVLQQLEVSGPWARTG